MESVSLVLGGDVMTGRGIDQILPHPGDPVLHEDYVRDATDYVSLAVQAHGPIPLPVSFDYVWGDARPELHRADARIVNLETSITTSAAHWPGKGIHYRMHPRNIGCLSAARLDCCELANNHVLDWGYAGLEETLRILDSARIAHAGAGRAADAVAPAIIDLKSKGRVLVLALGLPTSGVPSAWAATPARPGVNFLPALSGHAAARIAHDLLRLTRAGDITVVALHWGGNWGYEIPRGQIELAHRLIDEGIDIVHGHSSHHAKGIELRREGLILYGCGDLLNDYEGISGHEGYRDDLTLLYRVTLVPRLRRLVEVRLIPMQLRRFRLNRAPEKDARWLCHVLQRESARFSTGLRWTGDAGNSFVAQPGR